MSKTIPSIEKAIKTLSVSEGLKPLHPDDPKIIGVFKKGSLAYFRTLAEFYVFKYRTYKTATATFLKRKSEEMEQEKERLQRQIDVLTKTNELLRLDVEEARVVANFWKTLAGKSKADGNVQTPTSRVLTKKT